MAANMKAPYEKKAAEKKMAYESAMQEFKNAGGVAGKRRKEKADAKKERTSKRAKKEARKNSNQPAKPQSAYFLWVSAEGRAAAQKELGTKNIGPIGKHCGEA